jgi:hypothetical protein
MIQEGLILSRIMLSEGAKPGVITYSIILQGIFADWDGCFCKGTLSQDDYQWNMLGVITLHNLRAHCKYHDWCLA